MSCDKKKILIISCCGHCHHLRKHDIDNDDSTYYCRLNSELNDIKYFETGFFPIGCPLKDYTV